MANKGPTRDIFRIIIQNFINSLRPRKFTGNYIGEDYFGNKYYEIPPNPSIGKRKPSRYFEPADKEAFDQELTAEWEAWLRYRRNEPPTREELVQNLQIMEMKKRNAAELDLKFGKKTPQSKVQADGTEGGETVGTFPKYDQYESVPGQDPQKKS